MSKETGGFAFPSKVSNLSNEKQNIYGYDVPPGDSFIAGGMTLLDHFAGLALQGMLSNPEWNHWSTERHVKHAYEVADAMLLARGE
ncbi:hypothetical protein ACFL9S_10955 [Erwinia sp. AnSW2-5]|uniref:hypothetical protein n=1 Tax=Erwinia sp. AnSW2-5 TaxID=3367692 RepID=UPI00385812B9